MQRTRSLILDPVSLVMLSIPNNPNCVSDNQHKRCLCRFHPEAGAGRPRLEWHGGIGARQTLPEVARS